MEKKIKKFLTQIIEGHITMAEIEDMSYIILNCSLNSRRDYLNMKNGLQIFYKAFTAGLEQFNRDNQVYDKSDNIESAAYADISPDHDEKLFSPSEVAKILNVSRMTINNYINSGKLQASRLSAKKTRISETDLKRFIRNAKLHVDSQAA